MRSMKFIGTTFFICIAPYTVFFFNFLQQFIINQANVTGQGLSASNEYAMFWCGSVFQGLILAFFVYNLIKTNSIIAMILLFLNTMIVLSIVIVQTDSSGDVTSMLEIAKTSLYISRYDFLTYAFIQGMCFMILLCQRLKASLEKLHEHPLSPFEKFIFAPKSLNKQFRNVVVTISLVLLPYIKFIASIISYALLVTLYMSDANHYTSLTRIVFLTRPVLIGIFLTMIIASLRFHPTKWIKKMLLIQTAFLIFLSFLNPRLPLTYYEFQNLFIYAFHDSHFSFIYYASFFSILSLFIHYPQIPNRTDLILSLRSRFFKPSNQEVTLKNSDNDDEQWKRKKEG